MRRHQRLSQTRASLGAQFGKAFFTCGGTSWRTGAVKRLDPIDVVVLTKNSEDLLNECVRLIYENVPVNRLIFVDGFSTDNTLKIIDRFNRKYGNVKVIYENGTRARARTRGIQEVETPWFMFVDSDILLSKGWFKNAEKYMDGDTGAVWGLNIDIIPGITSRLFYRSQAAVAIASFNLRGGMHDTLIRTDLVKDMKIPEKLHAYEDAYIVNWVKKKGWKVRIGDDMNCLHIRPRSDWSFRESLTLATTEMRCGLVHSHVFKYIFYYPFFIFFWCLQVLGRNHEGSLSERLNGSTKYLQ